MATVSGSVNYEDSTPIPEQQEYTPSNIQPIAIELAKFIRTKTYGVDVRESLAQWVEVNLAVIKYLESNQADFIDEISSKEAGLEARQSQLEGRQTDVEDQFDEVIANATKDSEVILARDSSRNGNFSTLDARLEYMEELLGKYMPAGFNVTIKHNQNRKPTVTVHYYEYAIGTEPDGFGTAPGGLFGGTAATTVANQVDYPDEDTCIVHIPASYVLNGTVVYKAGYWYLIDGIKVLRFDLGTVDDDEATAGNGSNQTSTDSSGAGDDSGTGTNTTIPEVKNLKVTPIDDKTDRLDWDTA